MTPTATEQLLVQIDKLVAEGELVLTTKFNRSRGDYFDEGDPYVETQLFRKWLASCQNLIHHIGKPAQVWQRQFEGPFANQMVTVQSLLGTLQSLREAVKDELLQRLEDLVAADAFANLLEQADELLRKDYVLASGVLCRAVLEEHLRLLCTRHDCLPPDRPTINDLNQALYKETQLNKLAMQSVTAMATAGNHCAHNLQPPLSREDVENLLRGVRNFLVRHAVP
jgi:hypothetical protein